MAKGNLNRWIVGAGLLAGACTNPGADTPRGLAEEQWERCSHFPTVEFVEITPSGTLLIRDRERSHPPEAYTRCVASVAYEQFRAGRRDARTLVKAAYLTVSLPDDGTINRAAGQYPEPVDHFDPGQKILLFYVVEATESPIEMTFDWITPSGEHIRSNNSVGPTREHFSGTWSTDRLILPFDPIGSWHVHMFMNGHPAAELSFVVE